jgi:hypothetical protein
VVACTVEGSKQLPDPASWVGGTVTYYKVVVQRLVADGSADAPIPLERRYSHLKAFHGGWLAPVVSNAVPLLLPPADGWSKNAPAVVSLRCQGIEAMLQGALIMADRVGNPAVATAAQRFLTESLAALTVGAKEDTAGGVGGLSICKGTGAATRIWDPVGFWSWGSGVDIGAVATAAGLDGAAAIAVPHVLDVRPAAADAAAAVDGIVGSWSAGMLCRGHPAGGAVRAAFSWRSADSGASLELRCSALEVEDRWGNPWPRRGLPTAAAAEALAPQQIQVKLPPLGPAGVAGLGWISPRRATLRSSRWRPQVPGLVDGSLPCPAPRPMATPQYGRRWLPLLRPPPSSSRHPRRLPPPTASTNRRC